MLISIRNINLLTKMILLIFLFSNAKFKTRREYEKCFHVCTFVVQTFLKWAIPAPFFFIFIFS